MENISVDKSTKIKINFHKRRLTEDQDLFVREGDFVKYGEIVTKLDALEGASGGKDWSADIAVLEEKVTALENADNSHTHDMAHTHNNTQVKINETEIKLLKNSIAEIKAASSNPLAN